MVEAIKRHSDYRRVRCHMVASCADDAWVEDDGKMAMVLYPLHAIQGHDAQVGFAVDMSSRRVVATRVLVTLPEGIFSMALEALPVCGGRPQPCRDVQLAVLPATHSRAESVQAEPAASGPRS